MTSPLQQKLKITGPVIVTANRLGDGAVIFRVSVGHVGKSRPQRIVIWADQWILPLQVDMVADQDQGALRVFQINSTGGVG